MANLNEAAEKLREARYGTIQKLTHGKFKGKVVNPIKVYAKKINPVKPVKKMIEANKRFKTTGKGKISPLGEQMMGMVFAAVQPMGAVSKIKSTPSSLKWAKQVIREFRRVIPRKGLPRGAYEKANAQTYQKMRREIWRRIHKSETLANLFRNSEKKVGGIPKNLQGILEGNKQDWGSLILEKNAEKVMKWMVKKALRILRK